MCLYKYVAFCESQKGACLVYRLPNGVGSCLILRVGVGGGAVGVPAIVRPSSAELTMVGPTSGTLIPETLPPQKAPLHKINNNPSD